MYRGNPDPTPTFGSHALLVTAAGQPESIVYTLARTLFEKLDLLRRLHPAFAAFEPSRMVPHDRVAPVHIGAERYYREKNLLP